MKIITEKLKTHLSSLDKRISKAKKERSKRYYKFTMFLTSNAALALSSLFGIPIILGGTLILFSGEFFFAALGLFFAWSLYLIHIETKTMKFRPIKKQKKDEILKRVDNFITINKNNFKKEDLNCFNKYISMLSNQDIPQSWWDEFLNVINFENEVKDPDLIDVKNKLMDLSNHLNENEIPISSKVEEIKYKDII